MQTIKILIVFLFFSTSIYSQVDVAIEKNLLTSPPFQYGINLAYEIKITNNGNQAITNVALRDLVPCGLTFLSSSQPWTPAGSNLTTTITNIINPGESFSTFIDFTLVSCTTMGAWNNRTEIVSFTNTLGNALTDPNLNNNSGSVEADVYDLAMFKKLITPQPYTYDDILEFEITVFNQGNRPVNTVTIRDFVPILSGFTFDPLINPGWTGTATVVSRTISTPINPGGNTAIRIKLKLVRTAGGPRSWLNYAEIRLATDAFGNVIFDADSTPGSNSILENQVLPGDTNDDNLLTRGPAFSEDEDDHDPANAMVFDLALIKGQVTALQSFSYIQNVAYVFTVYNQGNTPATNIRVADYLSPALSYTATPLNVLRGWTYDNINRVANINFSEVLLPGQQDTFILDLKPNQFYVNQDMAWTDFGEITQADDTNPLTPNPIPDIDSRPDNNQTNDAGGKPNSPSDNAINGNGTGTYLSPDPLTDEDDHDSHKVQIVDLALTKKVVGSTTRQVGDQVVFEIKIINQGNVPLRNIEIIDSVGVGYTFTVGGVNAGWTGTLPRLRKIIAPVLLPMSDTTIFITLNVVNNANPNAYINYSEVVIAQDTFGFNRNDDADGTFDDMLFNDNLALPGSPNDNNILGDANLDEDEDDHDVAGITILCQKPTLTTGIPVCVPGSNTYSVTYYSSSSNITSSIGTITPTSITNIPLNISVVVTAITDIACTTTLTLPALNTCPDPNVCTLPKLTVGQALCNGTTYSVSYTHDVGTMSINAGIISGNSIINIPINVNLIVTATNNTCISRVQVTAPTDCNVPCNNPSVSISGPVCDATGSGTYEVNYILSAGASISTNVGNVVNGTVTDIPSGMNLVIIVSTTGCSTKTITVPAAICQLCQKPTLSLGIPVCNLLGTTYSITYYSNVQDITNSTGVLGLETINNIPFGTPITVTATSGPGCITSLTMPSLPSCPTTSGCTLPKLTVGQPLCNGNTYMVSFTNDIGIITTSSGSIVGNSIINIPIGTNIMVSATNTTCVTRINVTSPVGCNTQCINSPITISGPVCENNANLTYKINYIIAQGSTITASAGTLTSNSITDIPSGTAVTLTVNTQGCIERIITVPAAICQPPFGAVSTFVWHDINGDGQQSGSESGIPAVYVMLFSSANVMVASTYTDALGNANFNDIPAGFYYMKYTNANTYSVTFFDRGSDNTDSDVNNSNGAGTTTIFEVISNQTTSNVDAGYYICIPVGDLAWYDTNKNDKFDSFENGINGLDISIWRREGSIWVIWDQTVTGHKPNTNSDDGWWKFCVPPGQYYVSYELPPIGLVVAQPDRGGNEETDSDITGIFGYGTTPSFTVSSGQMKCDIGGGFYPMAVLGNLVWYDINADGIQDQGEAKVSDVLVEAIDPVTDEVLTTTETNSDGIYTLDYLQQREYYLRFTPPAGYQATLPLMLNDGDVDSDVDHSNGYNTTSTMSMASGQQNQGVDMGVVFAPLPVTWQDIKAYKKANHHLVTWSVSREWNTNHYIVQRQKNTDSQFYTISQEVKIEGSRTGEKKYNFEDFEIADGGTYLYRVIAVDFDGKIDYSQIVSVKQDGVFNVEVFPNPSNSLANISIEIPSEVDVDIKLYAVDGRFVKNILSNAKISQGSHVIALPMADVSAGVYKLIIVHDGKQEVKKIIRIN